jgi:hypothetical protein
VFFDIVDDLVGHVLLVPDSLEHRLLDGVLGNKVIIAALVGLAVTINPVP